MPKKNRYSLSSRQCLTPESFNQSLNITDNSSTDLNCSSISSTPNSRFFNQNSTINDLSQVSLKRSRIYSQSSVLDSFSSSSSSSSAKKSRHSFVDHDSNISFNSDSNSTFLTPRNCDERSKMINASQFKSFSTQDTNFRIPRLTFKERHTVTSSICNEDNIKFFVNKIIENSIKIKVFCQ